MNSITRQSDDVKLVALVVIGILAYQIIKKF